MRLEVTSREGDFRTLEKRMRALPAAHRRYVERDGMLAIAWEVANEARRSSAFQDRTGRLRRTIRAGVRRIRRYRSRLQTISVTLAGGVGAFQAHLVERGHGGPKPAPPHPYLLPAFNRTQDRLLRVGRRRMLRRLEAFERRLMQIK